MAEFPKISRMGERGILIEFEPEISSETLEKVLLHKKILQKKLFKEKIEVNNTYNSLLISYTLTIEDAYNEVLKVKELISQYKIPKKLKSQIFYIPVCYEQEFGLDLNLLSKEKNIGVDEIIRLHTQPVYQLYFIGFLPGFLYLGGLDKKLHFSRKETPRKAVKKGAVGIGENQTGIYPKSSPGGWQIIGNSPVELFDKNKEIPCPFSAGDHIKFYQVSKDEYLKIQEEIDCGKFKLKTEIYESGN